MNYLVSRTEIFATSIALTLTVFLTAPEKATTLWWDSNVFQNENKVVGNEKSISDPSTITGERKNVWEQAQK